MRRLSPACYDDMFAHDSTRDIYAINSTAAARRVREYIREGIDAGRFRTLHAEFVGGGRRAAHGRDPARRAAHQDRPVLRRRVRRAKRSGPGSPDHSVRLMLRRAGPEPAGDPAAHEVSSRGSSPVSRRGFGVHDEDLDLRFACQLGVDSAEPLGRTTEREMGQGRMSLDRPRAGGGTLPDRLLRWRPSEDRSRHSQIPTRSPPTEASTAASKCSPIARVTAARRACSGAASPLVRVADAGGFVRARSGDQRRHRTVTQGALSRAGHDGWRSTAVD